ncbi:hypothetical protein L1987_54436 [Smallanthus sonchifolius]|uniref:Uncharacterized protein n=1 Tax=Smallanthus sonchifolius TaxID=185202 RepID=A0ACB9E6R7_9ASTR|nr:hypothetical protein L1987_54436 [Smallanthus sonchifolius]
MVSAIGPFARMKVRGSHEWGKIISWAYFSDLNVYAVKREGGVQYFRYAHELKTLPGFEMNRLACLKLLYAEEGGRSGWLERALKFEYRNKWVNFKPQRPQRIIHKNKINPITKRPKVTLKWQPPTTMKKIQLRKLPQNFSRYFKWWNYDSRTGEAVIVLDKGDDWETIRVYDPMWLTNLSERDVYTLYKRPIFSDIWDMEQALQFQRVIEVCFAYEIHAGVSWKEKTKEFLRTD